MINVPVPVASLVAKPVANESCVLHTLQGRSIREKLAALESVLMAGNSVDLPVKHHFSRGVYARELFIPKGTVLVGKIHKFSQINIVLRGDISVLTEDGVKRVTAGATIVSAAGIKRAGYAHEDTVWMTIHGTHETDSAKLEDELIASSFEDYDRFHAALALEEKTWHG